MEDLKSIVIQRVPAELHKELKVLCATQGVTMRDMVLSLVKEATAQMTVTHIERGEAPVK